MLDDAHDDDGVEFLLRLEDQEVGEQDLEVVAVFRELVIEEALGDLGVGDAGEVHAERDRVARKGAPARADLENAAAGLQLAALDAIVEFPAQRRLQRLVVVLVDALAVGRQHRIEKAQEKLRVEIVVRGDRLLVGVDLPHDERLDEAPGRDQRMPVVERGAERKGLDHVAVDVEVALQVGFGDVALVEGLQRLDGAVVAQRHLELRFA